MADRILAQDRLPEIVFGASDPSESRAIGRLVKAGRLRNLAPRLYTSDLTGTPEAIVRRNDAGVRLDLWVFGMFDILPGLQTGEDVMVKPYENRE